MAKQDIKVFGMNAELGRKWQRPREGRGLHLQDPSTMNRTQRRWHERQDRKRRKEARK